MFGTVLSEVAGDEELEQRSDGFGIVQSTPQIGAELDVIKHYADPLMVLGCLEAVEGLAEGKISNHVKGEKLSTVSPISEAGQV